MGSWGLSPETRPSAYVSVAPWRTDKALLDDRERPGLAWRPSCSRLLLYPRGRGDV